MMMKRIAMTSKKNVLIRAQEFARIAHDGMVETTISGATRPKIVHLQEVADLVWASGGTDQEIMAAWLHDSIEDTAIALEDIENEFGREVASIVASLTDLDDFANLPLPERKKRQAERIRSENRSAQRVKLADQVSNVRFVATDPPTHMTSEECEQYIRGAKLIADECRGISPLLEELFDEAYRKGWERWAGNSSI